MSKDHAIHNENTCDYLLQSGQFNDWVVTTAFYSALHYVCNEIFPLEQNGLIYNNFEIYYRIIFKSNASKKSKHDVIISLVSLYLPMCKRAYMSLFDWCMASRYTNYIVSSQVASNARKDLEHIKRHLSK
ncbi:MAG: hypothetical protein LBE91_03965 [Tannerella sp.]|jgi:hypothetical protein|nr:hypothetical protein [Tannerella sp.]